MTDGDIGDGTPGVWDPTANGGAGAWVRRRATPEEPGAKREPAEHGQATAEVQAQAPAAADADGEPEPGEAEPPPVQPAGPPVAPPPPPAVPPPPPAHSPAPTGGSAPRRLPRTKWIVAAAAALLIIVVGMTWSLSTGGGSPAGGPPGATTGTPPASGWPTGGAASTNPAGGSSVSPSSSAESPNTDTAAGQAAALDELLDSSAEYNKDVVTAKRTVQSCADASSVADASTALEGARDGYQELLGQLDALPLDKVKGGPDAAKSLEGAWQNSADAAQKFAEWTVTVKAAVATDSCVPGKAPHGNNYDLGNVAFEKAATAKGDFVAKWNKMAEEYGLPKRSSDEI